MTANRKPWSTQADRELRLSKVDWALGLAFAAAVLSAGGILYGLVVLLDFKEIDSNRKLDAETLFDLVKLSFGVVAGTGALVALVVAYRRQHVDDVAQLGDGLLHGTPGRLLDTGRVLMTRETVPRPTPASAATSSSVGVVPGRRFTIFTPPPGHPILRSRAGA